MHITVSPPHTCARLDAAHTQSIEILISHDRPFARSQVKLKQARVPNDKRTPGREDYVVSRIRIREN